MCPEAQGNRKKMTEEFIIEKQLQRTWIQRIEHTICLLFPIAGSFLGYFLSPVIYKTVFSQKTDAVATPELFRFFTVVCFFLITSFIVFVKTRNTNPIIKIRVLNKKK